MISRFQVHIVSYSVYGDEGELDFFKFVGVTYTYEDAEELIEKHHNDNPDNDRGGYETDQTVLYVRGE